MSSSAPRPRSPGATCWPTSGSAQLFVPHDALDSSDPFTCFTPPAWTWSRSGTATAGRSPLRRGPGSSVYDRAGTVVRKHVEPGVAVPLHPEAGAFAEHYGFSIDVLPAYRHGWEERQVLIVRDHVIAGRSIDFLTELDGAFAEWLPIRRA